ncbi:MAG: response regulator transcription factor [Oscillospiraceae bacterium]|nr:response regulator transcription factor [Oscillospiraceae bacterium]
MYRILIIEDDAALRQALKALLEKYGYAVSAAEDFRDVTGFALATQPQLILLDINLPYSDGFHICRELRRQSNIPIIVVTSRDSETDELISLHLGADHFVTKPYNTQILLAKIAALLSRAYEAGAAKPLQFGGLRLDPGKSTAEFEGRRTELSKNELRILQLLVERQGDILSRDEIMHALWQTDAFVDDNTLTVNINRLRRRLAEIGAGTVLKTRRGQGYSL